MIQPVLKVTNMKKAYGAIQAVGGVSFEVRPGEIFGVIGPNGESWSGRGRKPLWLLAMEGKDVAATEPVPAAETDQADLVLPL